jgi:cephalosporin hydroxylase
MVLRVDLEKGLLTVSEADGERTYPLSAPEAFSILSDAWVRCGWDSKYVYSFTWLGRPIIQLPDDLMRMQEVIFQVAPDLIIETGVAHGGSLVFYAGICRLLGRGRVIGIDIEIRPHNREAIEAHFLSDMITLIEGSSTDAQVVEQVRSQVRPSDCVLVILDSNHTKQHVLGELNAYASLVSKGSYIVVTDGIMASLVGAPRSNPDWGWNNPQAAAKEFVASDPRFVIETPEPPFNEGATTRGPTYWPNAWLKRQS